MDRRIILSGLAAGAALAAGPARAQTAPPAPPAARADPPAAVLSDAARAHARDTLAAGALSLLLSRAAQGKLRHPMTRQFADFEVAEQEGLADVLTARLSGAPPSGTVRPPTDAEADAALDGDGRAALARFRDTAPGPDCEKSYVEAQVEGHKRLLGIQDAYLQAADDPAETAVAKLAKGRIQEHLVLLGDIGRHLG